MADDVTQGVYHRLHFFEGRGRRFTVRIRSDRHGYSGRLFEHLPDGAVMPASFTFPPRQEIDPASFYKDRRGMPATLIRLLNEELAAGRVTRLREGGGQLAKDPFLRANLTGWPNGYSGGVDDDFVDWIDIHPHWYAA